MENSKRGGSKMKITFRHYFQYNNGIIFTLFSIKYKRYTKYFNMSIDKFDRNQWIQLIIFNFGILLEWGDDEFEKGLQFIMAK